MSTATSSLEQADPSEATVSMPLGHGRRLAADAVCLLHIGVVGFVMTCWALPIAPLWWLMLALAPLMHLQWRMNDDRCLLSDLETHLRRMPPPEAATPDPERTFIGRLLRPVFGPVPMSVVDGLSYGVLWASFSGCAARLAAG
ncbi:MAG TPA: DUF2784 family protein [Myxococcota bacterium]|nr:DUF2784 family protein [Myxococcota bacterium]